MSSHSDQVHQWFDEGGDDVGLRKFDPCEYGFRAGAIPSEVLMYDPDCCTMVHINGREKDCVALYADGACSGNGTPRARASMGVYGGPGAWYNQGCLLPLSEPQTNQSAEIHAAILALDIFKEIFEWNREGRCFCTTTYLVVMDSNYVVQAMTDWIRKWRANNFRNARGLPLINGDAFQRLDNEIKRLLVEHRVNIRFWYVPREHNVGADRMAADALK